MDKNIFESMKQTHKNAVVKGTIYSYIQSISEIFIASPETFEKTCKKFGLSSDELIAILNSDHLSNISFLDAIMSYNTSNIKHSEVSTEQYDGNRFNK